MPYLNEAFTLENVQNIYDTVVCVDVASFDRVVEDARKIFDNARVTINIDHHKTNRGYAQYNYVIGESSSAGEVLFEMFDKSGIEISLEMANALYVSILTDTGCFKYETVSPETFAIASKLAKIGVDTATIARNCYDLKSKPKVMFQANCVSNAKFVENDKIVYCSIKGEDLAKFGAKDEHTEGIVEVLRSIKPVEFAIVLKENNGATKVSLRSKEKDVTKVVQRFNGGGHTRAAGCTIKKPLDEALLLLLEEVKKNL